MFRLFSRVRITAPSRDTCHIIGHFYAVFLEGGYKAKGTRDGGFTRLSTTWKDVNARLILRYWFTDCQYLFLRSTEVKRYRSVGRPAFLYVRRVPQGYTNFSKNLGPTPNSRRQKADVKQVPYRGRTI